MCSICGGNNTTGCLSDGETCSADTDCVSLNCDACLECGGSNVQCYGDGVACTADNQCSSDTCDACGYCGSANPTDCLSVL